MRNFLKDAFLDESISVVLIKKKKKMMLGWSCLLFQAPLIPVYK